MNVPLRHLIGCSLGIFALTASQAISQPYPSKPIRYIMPLEAGSMSDVVARAAGQELSTRLGQPLLVDNRPGTAGIIGAEACAKAAPDGYTICTVNISTMSLNRFLFDKLPYNPDKDFKPVTLLYFTIETLVAAASLPVDSVSELRALATAKPGLLNYGTLGVESNPDLFRQWLRNEWSADIVGIPYKGGGSVAAALVAGDIHITSMGIGNFIGQIKSGKVKSLAVLARKRSRLLPNVPTFAEAGLSGFPGRGAWWGLTVPTGTVDPIVTRLNAEFVKLFNEPRFAGFLEDRALEPAVGTPEAFASFLKADRDTAAFLVKMARQAR